MLVVTADRNINDICIKYSITDKYVEAIITDKNTDEFLESYKEVFESEINKKRLNNIIYRTLESNHNVKPAIVKTKREAMHVVTIIGEKKQVMIKMVLTHPHL